MNDNLNLVEILENCPKGTKLYSTMYGEVEFLGINTHIDTIYNIEFKAENGALSSVTTEGKYFDDLNGECTLFPSREQRDWSKFKLEKFKQPKFDPKTLKPFDKVLARDDRILDLWRCTFFSHIKSKGFWEYATADSAYAYCIPYNEDTKHLVDTTYEAPEYYRYWED